MEVHHHPHSGHKKRWTSYLLEFFMLFLAVFLGFIAENIREHKIEHKRTREFAKSLVRDLQNDTTGIHNQIKLATTYICCVDSLVALSKTKLEGRNASQFSFYTRFMYWTVPITWNRATFEQIKNSGSLRYFKNYKLLEKLTEYDALVNDIESEAYNHTIRGNLLLKQISVIIEPAYHSELSKYYIMNIDTMSTKTIESLYPANPETLETKRNEIREMLNLIIVQQRNLKLDIDALWMEAEKLAIELIKGLREEYHLD